MNRQTKRLSQIKQCTRNMGADTKVFDVAHGNGAFLAPDRAKNRLKDRGSRTWKVTGRHPSNVEIGKR